MVCKRQCLRRKNSHIWPNMHGGSANLDVSATNKIPPEDIVSFEGPPGTVCFDLNGFHRGGRVTTGSRIATHACYLAPTAPHIVNNVLGSFEYNKDEINVLDKQSAEYQLLSDRQKESFRMIKCFDPDIGEKDKKNIIDTLESKILAYGPNVEKFEKEQLQVFK